MGKIPENVFGSIQYHQPWYPFPHLRVWPTGAVDAFFLLDTSMNTSISMTLGWLFPPIFSHQKLCKQNYQTYNQKRTTTQHFLITQSSKTKNPASQDTSSSKKPFPCKIFHSSSFLRDGHRLPKCWSSNIHSTQNNFMESSAPHCLGEVWFFFKSK